MTYSATNSPVIIDLMVHNAAAQPRVNDAVSLAVRTAVKLLMGLSRPYYVTTAISPLKRNQTVCGKQEFLEYACSCRLKALVPLAAVQGALTSVHKLLKFCVCAFKKIVFDTV
jgi:hypothetical protein